MTNKMHRRQRRLLIRIFVVLGIFLAVIFFQTEYDREASKGKFAAAMAPIGERDVNIANIDRPENPISVTLPIVQKSYPWSNPFGVETNKYFKDGTEYLTRAEELEGKWVRLNFRISWRKLQPNEGDPIDWSALAEFEDELRVLKSKGMTPIVIIDDHPHWAVIPYQKDGQWVYSSCAAIKAEKFGAFVDFVRQIVARYSQTQFNVHHWELGNEPDVDPLRVPVDNGWGCWGDKDDPYFGGEHYGEMLKVVTPVIRSSDPLAKVWIGGLLLDSPNTDPVFGRPEFFLQGILEADAEDHFDILAYHSYPPYQNIRKDYDTDPFGKFIDWGGNVVGKARYLRSVMGQYGVDKPVFLNETGLMCPDHDPYAAYCTPPSASFFQAQADHVVRTFVRGTSENIMGFIWYTLNGPGWRYTGLLEGNYEPKLVYLAYQQMIVRLENSVFFGRVGYGDGLEGYAFEDGVKTTHVVWAEEDQVVTISVPEMKLIEAYDQYGNILPKSLVGSAYQFHVGFSPIYLIID